jgi:hypothetical protein
MHAGQRRSKEPGAVRAVMVPSGRQGEAPAPKRWIRWRGDSDRDDEDRERRVGINKWDRGKQVKIVVPFS